MQYYFDEPEKRLLLREELNSWIGTPFRHGCGVKKYGTDCIRHVCGVLRNVGAVSPKIKIPNYPKDFHLHRSKELLREGVIDKLNVEEVGVENPKDGDIILYQFGRVASHASIYFRGCGYHSISGQNNMRLNYGHQFRHGKKKFGFRVLRGK